MRDLELVQALSHVTGLPVHYVEVEPDTTVPFYIIHAMPSMALTGSMGRPNTDGDFQYQTDVIGVNEEQVLLAEKRLIDSMTAVWSMIPGCMGPAEIRRNGITKEDDRTYKATVIIVLKIGESV